MAVTDSNISNSIYELLPAALQEEYIKEKDLFLEGDVLLEEYGLYTEDINECDDFRTGMDLGCILGEEFKDSYKLSQNEKKRQEVMNKYAVPKPVFDSIIESTKYELTRIAEEILVDYPELSVPELYTFHQITGPVLCEKITPNLIETDDSNLTNLMAGKLMDASVEGEGQIDASSNSGLNAVSKYFEVEDENCRGGLRMFSIFSKSNTSTINLEEACEALSLIIDKYKKVLTQKVLNEL